MITLTRNSNVTIRGRSFGLWASNMVDTNMLFSEEGKRSILMDTFSTIDDRLVFYVNHNFTNRQVTTPVLQDLITNCIAPIKVKYKEAWYIVNKNTLYAYNPVTEKINPLMLAVKTADSPKTIKDIKIVINPVMFSTDTSFRKMFDTILQTGVDIELTKYIEERYFFKPKLPKFGNITDSKKYVESVTEWVFGEMSKETLI